MKKYQITGKNRLSGELEIGGAKNAVLPVLAALCLVDGDVILENCPRLSDTFDSIEILNGIGFKTDFTKNTLKVFEPSEINTKIPDENAKKMRSSIIFMGAMLAKHGEVSLAMPGGCDLGERAIDMHIDGLEKMGALVCVQEGRLYAKANGLKGTNFSMHTVSVGTTENLMIAAALADGETVLKNAAREPEIIDLAKFLKSLGAKIQGEGTDVVVINGVKKLKMNEPYKIMPDRIVAGTYLLAAAMTSGEINLTNINLKDMLPILSRLEKMGCHMKTTENSVHLKEPGRLLSLYRLATSTHPGFPTDMQPQFVSALSTAVGRSHVIERIFEKRYSHINELKKMGADIDFYNGFKAFTIYGRKYLHGAEVEAHDLRCGAALILAALAAEGETTIKGVNYVERGYESIVSDLQKLGANIRAI